MENIQPDLQETLSQSAAEMPQPAQAKVRRVALIGNVCVGKTCLFDHLCVNHACSTNIAGSTICARQGVLAVGSGGAPRRVRRHCSSCKSSRHRKIKPCCRSHESFGQARAGNHECPDDYVKKALSRSTVTHLYDTPGSATLAVNSEDEMVARDLILSGQIDSLI
ncbi:MAG: hypothetical protein ABIK28_20460, partial [Planctomycetota bacterium]